MTKDVHIDTVTPYLCDILSFTIIKTAVGVLRVFHLHLDIPNLNFLLNIGDCN